MKGLRGSSKKSTARLCASKYGTKQRALRVKVLACDLVAAALNAGLCGRRAKRAAEKAEPQSASLF